MVSVIFSTSCIETTPKLELAKMLLTEKIKKIYDSIAKIECEKGPGCLCKRDGYCVLAFSHDGSGDNFTLSSMSAPCLCAKALWVEGLELNTSIVVPDNHKEIDRLLVRYSESDTIVAPENRARAIELMSAHAHYVQQARIALEEFSQLAIGVHPTSNRSDRLSTFPNK